MHTHPKLANYLHNYYSNRLALYYASLDGCDEEVLELLQGGVLPNSDYCTRKNDGRSPLHIACAYSHLRSAEVLIKFGAIVAATDNNGLTPLHWACSYNKKDSAKLLLEHHCPTSEPGCYSLAVSVCMSSCSGVV